MIEIVPFIIGLFATCFTLSSTIPQIKKVLDTKEADDISKKLIILLIIGLFFWMMYGVFVKDLVIMVSNFIGVSLNLFLLTLKFRYSRST